MDFDLPPPYDRDVPHRISKARRELSPQGEEILERFLADEGDPEDIAAAIKSLSPSEQSVLFGIIELLSEAYEATANAQPGEREEVPKVAEGDNWIVPAFYHKPDEPGIYHRWDNSPEAWTWKQVRDIRDEFVIEGAARTLAITGTFEQLPAIMVNAGWATAFDEEEFEDFIRAHEEAIRRRADSIRSGAG